MNRYRSWPAGALSCALCALVLLVIVAPAGAGGSGHNGNGGGNNGGGKNGGGGTVTICHISSNSPYAQTMSVSQSTEQSYFNHGDYLGACSTLEVRKVLIPSSDHGRFNLLVDSSTDAWNVGDGGTTGARAVTPGQHHSASEAAGSSTSLANYTSSYVCMDGSTTVASGTGTTTGPLPAAIAGHSVVCTFTNRGAQVTLCAVSSSSPYAQTLTVAQSAEQSYLNHGGYLGACSTLEVKKVLVPSSDHGKFNLLIDTTTDATNVGNGGTTHARAVSIGSQHSASEVAGSSTSLTNYNSVFVCKDGSTTIASGSGTTTGLLPAAVAGHSVVCTFTNTKQAVPLSAHLIIDKVTAPSGDPTLFTFTPSANLSGTNFQLADATTPKNFTVSAGTYSVTEAATHGWNLTGLVCSDNSSQTVASATASVNLTAGETVTCTFTNTKQTSLEMTKTVVPADNSTWTFAFTNNADLPTILSNNATPYDSGSLPIDPGTVSIFESAGTNTDFSNYTPSVSCTDNGSLITTTPTFTGSPLTYSFTIGSIAQGDKIVCAFTNTLKAQTTYEITKTVVPADSSAWNFVVNNNSGDGINTYGAEPSGFDSGAVVIQPGTLEFSETANGSTDFGNYTPSVSCTDNGSPLIAFTTFTGSPLTYSFTITVAQGDKIVCAFTNTFTSPTLEITKTVVPAQHDRSMWDFGIYDSSGYSLEADVSAPYDSGVIDIDPGSLTIVESAGDNTVFSNYTPTVTCTKNGSPVSFDTGPSYDPSEGTYSLGLVGIVAGDKIVCAYTNTAQEATLEITKTVSPPDGSEWSFALTNNLLTSSYDNESAPYDSGSISIDPGSLSLVESAGTSTDFSDYTPSVSCTKNGSPVSFDTGPSYDSNEGTYSLGLVGIVAGDQIVCNYLNTLIPPVQTKTGTIEIEKTVTNAPDSGLFDFVLTQGATVVYSIDDQGNGFDSGAQTVAAGSYSLAEGAGSGTGLSNYASVLTCKDGAGNDVTTSNTGTTATVSVSTGAVVLCQFTNTHEEAYTCSGGPGTCGAAGVADYAIFNDTSEGGGTAAVSFDVTGEPQAGSISQINFTATDYALSGTVSCSMFEGSTVYFAGTLTGGSYDSSGSLVGDTFLVEVTDGTPDQFSYETGTAAYCSGIGAGIPANGPYDITSGGITVISSP